MWTLIPHIYIPSLGFLSFSPHSSPPGAAPHPTPWRTTPPPGASTRPSGGASRAPGLSAACRRPRPSVRARRAQAPAAGALAPPRRAVRLGPGGQRPPTPSLVPPRPEAMTQASATSDPRRAPSLVPREYTGTRVSADSGYGSGFLPVTGCGCGHGHGFRIAGAGF